MRIGHRGPRDCRTLWKLGNSCSFRDDSGIDLPPTQSQRNDPPDRAQELGRDANRPIQLAHGHEGPGRARIVAFVGLAFLIGIAIWLRFSGLDHDLPNAPSRDGLKIVVQAELMRLGVWDGGFENRWDQYPHLLARLVALLPADDPTQHRTLAEHITGASAMWMQARAINALAGVAAVALTYVLARRFLDRARSLFAAGLIATSLLHVDLSTQERPHALFTTLVVCSALAALRMRRRADRTACALAATTSGLAIGALQSGPAVLPMLATAWWLRDPPRRAKQALAFGAVLLLALTIAAVFYPFVFTGGVDRPRPVPSPSVLSVWGKGIDLRTFDGSGFAHMAEPLWNGDPLFFVLALAGVVALLKEGLRILRKQPKKLHASTSSHRLRDAAVVSSFALPYLVVFGMYGGSTERYVLPLLPFLACAAAAAIPRRFGAASLALLAFPIVVAGHVASLRTRADTIELAAAYIAEHADPDDRIVTTPLFDLPIFTADEALRANAEHPWRTIWSEYQSRLGDTPREGPHFEVFVEPFRGSTAADEARANPLAWFDAQRVRWFVTIPEHAAPRIVSAGRDRMALVARFATQDDENGRTPAVRPLWTWTPRCFDSLRAHTAGPTVEVYRRP